MNDEVKTKLNSFLEKINECLMLGDMGLLKSEVLYDTKHGIEDELKGLKSNFAKIESLKIEKAIPPYRNVPKRGIFVNADETNKHLKDLHVLVQELLNSLGSEVIKPVPAVEIKTSNNTINRAINDARALIEKNGDSVSAIDRLHTLLHAYLRELCEESGIKYTKEDSLNQLLKLLRLNHPVFQNQDIYMEHIMKSFSNILDKLNPVRNDASMAHANNNLLKPEEAMLVVDTIHTILRYLTGKIVKKDSL